MLALAASLIVGAGLAAAAYRHSKSRRKASTTQSAALAAVGGAAGGAATWATVSLMLMGWPLLVAGGIVAAYILGRRSQQKALPPARS